MLSSRLNHIEIELAGGFGLSKIVGHEASNAKFFGSGKMKPVEGLAKHIA